MQKAFAEKVVSIIKSDPAVLGLAVGGSWLTNQLDEFSDLDLVLVTKNKISGYRNLMIAYAKSFGDFISGFTGEHVNEPRLLICLYDNPLLHVDIKFLTPDELTDRIEDPEILFEKKGAISEVLAKTKPRELKIDLQWIEDRFWTWIHYTSTKIGRGEFFDVLSSLDFLRANVLAPMMKEKTKRKYGGIRRVETELNAADLENLKITVARYDKESLVQALDNCISIYKGLRRKLGGEKLNRQELTEKKSIEYFKSVKK
jgi:hypothetical protein